MEEAGKPERKSVENLEPCWADIEEDEDHFEFDEDDIEFLKSIKIKIK